MYSKGHSISLGWERRGVKKIFLRKKCHLNRISKDEQELTWQFIGRLPFRQDPKA